MLTWGLGRWTCSLHFHTVYWAGGFSKAFEIAAAPALLPGEPMDGGAWRATVHGVAKSQTWHSDWTVQFSSVAQSCPTLCDPMNCSLPSSSVHRISQARMQEWVAISYSRGSSRPRDPTHTSCIGRQVLYHWATWETWFKKYSLSDLPEIFILFYFRLLILYWGTAN